MKYILGVVILAFIVGIYFFITQLIKFFKKIKQNPKTSQVIKLEKQMKEIKKKIQQIEDDLEIIPKIEDDVVKSMKNILEETKKKLEEELEELCKIYTKLYFNKIYVIYSLNTVKTFSEKMKELYAILAEKHFGNNEIDFITKNTLYKQIEHFNNIAPCSIWNKKYIDAIIIIEENDFEDGMYLKPYINPLILNNKNKNCY